MADSTLRTRRRTLLACAAVAVVLVAAGFVAARFVKSPQQVAAEAAGPGPTTLTAVVERRPLTSTVVVRGQVAASRQVEVTPSGDSSGGQPVVTGVRVKRGDELAAGQLLLEVSGRPLVALTGTKPAYRDLRPGYEGEDVKQLQSALAAAGHDPGELDGVFGSGTKAALTRFYDTLGYPVEQTGEDDDRRLRDADRSVTAAQRALTDARALTPPSPQAVARAQEDLASAEEQRDEVERSTGAMLPLSEYAFLPSFPARVADSKAVLGKQVEAPLITLSAGALGVTGLLDPGRAGLVQPGRDVEIRSEALGLTARGVVESVGELVSDPETGDAGAGAAGHPLVVTPSGELDPRLAGADVRLTVVEASSGGPVLVVPVSALFSSAGDRVEVVKQRADLTEERIAVTIGVHGDGFAAVVPVDGALAEGDRVVVSAVNAEVAG
ncbi:putative peptidoglycan binding protein [Saccharothrix saharensis]|uniref:Putative peptidoglycan binding protein n=1 Tax=Saccharothrix saharensis TaxID=571190 RepID=A0A543JFE1_9PSEU|nr:peptidoglycan-binding domain-containing protein [Saccharothrix saharensis]TQM81557.1 putative peptidoglycan binding protein [Saccharothrix saharensis]